MADDITVLGVDVAPFLRGLSAATTGLGAFGAALGIGALTNFLQGVLNNAGALADQAAALDLNVEKMQELNYAFGQSGASAEDISASLIRLNGSIQDLSDGSPKVTKAFADLNIASRDIAGLDIDRVIERIADGFAAASDKGKATAAVIDLLGKSARKLIPLMAEGSEGIKKLREESSKLSEEDVKILDEFGDKWASTMQVVKVKAAEATLAVASLISKLWDFITMKNEMEGSGLTGNYNKLLDDAKKRDKENAEANGPDKKVEEHFEKVRHRQAVDRIDKEAKQKADSAQAEIDAKTAISDISNENAIKQREADKQAIAAQESREYNAKEAAKLEEQHAKEYEEAWDEIAKDEEDHAQKLREATEEIVKLNDQETQELYEQNEQRAVAIAQEQEMLRLQKEQSENRAAELATENRIQEFRDRGDNADADELANKQGASDERRRAREQGATPAEIAEIDRKEAAKDAQIRAQMGRETQQDRRAARNAKRQEDADKRTQDNRDAELERRSKVDEVWNEDLGRYVPRRGRNKEVDKWVDRKKAAEANQANEAKNPGKPKVGFDEEDKANLRIIKENLTPDGAPA